MMILDWLIPLHWWVVGVTIMSGVSFGWTVAQIIDRIRNKLGRQ